MGEVVQGKEWTRALAVTLAKSTPEEKAIIKRLAKSISYIRNLGDTGELEVIAAIGILAEKTAP